jgi:hypothetical protein
MYLSEVCELSLIGDRLCFPLSLLCFLLDLLMLVWIQQSYRADHSISNRDVTKNSLLSIFSLFSEFSRLVHLFETNKKGSFCVNKQQQKNQAVTKQLCRQNPYFNFNCYVGRQLPNVAIFT